MQRVWFITLDVFTPDAMTLVVLLIALLTTKAFVNYAECWYMKAHLELISVSYCPYVLVLRFDPDAVVAVAVSCDTETLFL